MPGESGRETIPQPISSEREGFEPSVPLNGVRVLSRDVPSAAQPPFRMNEWAMLIESVVFIKQPFSI